MPQGNAQTLKVTFGQLRKNLSVNVVLAERCLILPQAEGSQPTRKVGRSHLPVRAQVPGTVQKEGEFNPVMACPDEGAILVWHRSRPFADTPSVFPHLITMPLLASISLQPHASEGKLTSRWEAGFAEPLGVMQAVPLVSVVQRG
jgi:hypothetical protein